MRTTAAIAAALLAIVTLGGFVVTSWPLVGLEAKHVHLKVTGPQRVEPGTDNLFTVETTSPSGRPLAAGVHYTLKTPDGKSLVLATQESTARNGRLTLNVRPAAEITAVQNATFEIAAGDGDAAPLSTSLVVEPTGLATQLSLDKPLYQPGEIVRFRSLTLTRFGLNSATDAVVYFELHDPSGAVVPNSWTTQQSDRGVAGGEFSLPVNLPGGEYTLFARSPSKQFAEEKRTFFVRQYRLPRLKKDLEFTRDSYSPGDAVVADLSVQRTEGAAAAGAKLHAIASVDGQAVWQSDSTAGPDGSARIEFKLPEKISRGDAQLAVVVDDGGNKETVAKTIRINLDRVDVSLYPEGGDLVAGLENRVYFTSRTPLGKPAHVAGLLLDSGRREVAKLETTYKGMGSFKFTPKLGESYTVEAGKLEVKSTPDSLVAMGGSAIRLSTGPGVFAAKQPLTVDLVARDGGEPLVVAAYCRGVLVGQETLTARRGTNHVEIPLASGAAGVVRITVFDKSADFATSSPRAVAERLVYRRPERVLNVRVGEHKPRYSPGDPVELPLFVTNERGEPAAAALGVSVAADSLFKLIDDELPSMTTHFYLTSEIEKPEDLEKADFFLSDDPKAPAALDLLLGTQGWRRFADRTGGEFVQSGDRKPQPGVVAAAGQSGGPPISLDNGEQVARTYQAALDKIHANRSLALGQLGRGMLLAGAPVALLFIFIAAWGAIGTLRFWLPTLGTATACFALAWIWSSNGPAGDAGRPKVAMANTSGTADKPTHGEMTNDDWSKSTANFSPAQAVHAWAVAPTIAERQQRSTPMVYAGGAALSWYYAQSNGFYFNQNDFPMVESRGSPYEGFLSTFSSYQHTTSTLTLTGANTWQSINKNWSAERTDIGELMTELHSSNGVLRTFSGISLNSPQSGDNVPADGIFDLGATSNAMLTRQEADFQRVGDGNFTLSSTNSFAKALSSAAQPTTVNRAATGTLILAGANTYSGATITAGTLSLGNSIAQNINGTIIESSVIDARNSNNNYYAGAFAVGNGGVGNGWALPSVNQTGGIVSTGGTVLNVNNATTLTKTGAGTFTLGSGTIRGGDAPDGVNDFGNTTTGAVTVNGGTILAGANASGVSMAWRTRTYRPDTGGRPDNAANGSLSVHAYRQYLADRNVTSSTLDGEVYLGLVTRNGSEPIDDTKIGDGEPVNDAFILGMNYNPSMLPNGSYAASHDGASVVIPSRDDLEFTNPVPPVEFRQGSFSSGRPVTFQFREYAYTHHHESSASGARADFAETLYWNPLLITGADGKTTIKFDLSDAVAKFRVLIDAHATSAAQGEGRIGTGSSEVVAKLPVSVEPKLPLEVTAGDRIDLPVAVVNDTDGPLPVSLAVNLPSAEAPAAIIAPTTARLVETDGANLQKLELPAGGRSRAYFPLNVTGNAGAAMIEVRGQTADGKPADAKRQPLAVVPSGYPVAASYGGILSGDAALTVRVPKDCIPGSLAVRLAVYPSPIGEMESGLEGILREPTGCFEQISTSNYPNILILEYLQEQNLADPALMRRCKALLQTGYRRLVSYESKSGGFEWFGGDPGHEMLTAYGLMEFTEMARVFPVDAAMLERTTKWLLGRRDGKGGFQRGDSNHQFGFGSKDVNDAYITWALTEAGVGGIEAEVKHAIVVGRKSEDPYVIALAALSALNSHDEAAGREMLEWLVKLQAKDGHLDGRESFAYSGGVSLQVETTALAARAWLKQPAYTQQAQKAIEWISAHREGSGGFGSTQATILALKALVEHARLSHKTTSGGELIIKRDGQTIGKQAFAAGQQGTIRIDGLASKLEPGENRLTISLTGDNRMPYSLDVSFRSLTGPSDPACDVRLATKLAAATIKSGETVSLDAELSNATDKPLPMTVAILGLPAGLEPRAKQLDDLKKAGTIDYYETRPREIVCYWRKLSPNQKIPLRLDLVAEVPGQYTAPASRAYLYYTAERKQWTEPLRVTISRE